jgi:AraC family transcriptional regulator of adaptative response/methylated-DNA-[protein]-cysteine methyltransferase
MAAGLKSPKRYATDDDRWEAVKDRDRAADGKFVYAVKTTGVYCRPQCSSRLALRKNVRFFADVDAAERAGFRPCKRCQPRGEDLAQRQAELIVQACRQIESAEQPPSLAELAAHAGLSLFHFHRLFKSHTGVTPKAYAIAHRTQRVRGELARAGSVTQAIYNAGYSSSGQFYAAASVQLGMPPKLLRSGGKDTSLHYAVSDCWLGRFLVAATEIGVCAILLGDDDEALLAELRHRFPRAELLAGDRDFAATIKKVATLLKRPTAAIDLPLDIHGTAFQQQVWQLLRQVPAGTTTTYSALAKQLGQPQAVRAVASAVASNPLAVAVPCHRVIRASGDLAGYRWGVERKRQLLNREKRNAE